MKTISVCYVHAGACPRDHGSVEPILESARPVCKLVLQSAFITRVNPHNGRKYLQIMYLVKVSSRIHKELLQLNREIKIWQKA